MKSKILKVLSIITVVPFIIQIIISQRKKSNLRKKVLADGTNDYIRTAQNIANSISKSKALYKELIVKVHPDRFTHDKKEEATELAARITKAKRNYDALTLLKKDVEDFLNVVNS
ncbi:hypothetical protein [Daejeonella sp.]|uniref:hypothetical protein n=1 Tax=Daejeonella sp. TaxID=2805397 RepID=UPI0025BA3B43|nr:hypothetical protein [Daejeonella sp.]